MYTLAIIHLGLSLHHLILRMHKYQPKPNSKIWNLTLAFYRLIAACNEVELAVGTFTSSPRLLRGQVLQDPNPGFELSGGHGC